MSPKICVIGSSYIGAPFRAYKELPSAQREYEVDFYGRGAGRFQDIRIVDGQVRNARFSSNDKSINVRDYEAFVFYADLPSPYDLATVISECLSANASRQLIKALVKDIVHSTATFRVAKGLGEAGGKPVLLLSRNVPAPPKVTLHEAAYETIASLLRRAVTPYIYVPFPRALFTSDFRPDPKFYQGSLDIAGEVAGTNERRDRNHMNELGGRLILNLIFKNVSEARKHQL